MRLIRHLRMAIILLFANTLTAQTGQYDTRFSIKNYDCGNKIVTIQLQVRAISVSLKFNMGDANYRFEYDPRLIDHPRLVAQPNFSNQSPDRDMNYGVQNLNGTSKGQLQQKVS